MGKLLSRVLGVGIGGCALTMALFAMMFRMDSLYELREIVRLDVAVGAALAVASSSVGGTQRGVPLPADCPAL